MGQKKFSDEEYLELHRKGLNDTEAAKRLEVSQPAVTLRRNQLGLPPNFRGGGRRKEFTDEEYLELHRKGLNDAEAAKRLDVSQPTVTLRRNQLGLSPNARGGRGRKEFTDEEYLELYMEGVNDREAAEELDVSVPTVNARRKEMGLPPNDTKGSRIPLDDLIEELHELAKELGNPPTALEVDLKGKYSSTTYRMRFGLGSWSRVLKAAGFLPEQNA